MSGSIKPLQFTIKPELFVRGRLNPQIPLDDAGDCGANSLFILGEIDEALGTELSRKQNECFQDFNEDRPFRHPETIEAIPFYTTYLFQNIAHQYQIKTIDISQLNELIDDLMPGKGTIITFSDPDSQSHVVVLIKGINGTPTIIDNQQQKIIVGLDNILHHLIIEDFKSLIFPTIQKKRDIQEEAEEETKVPKKSRKFTGGKRTKKINKSKKITRKNKNKNKSKRINKSKKNNKKESKKITRKN